MYADREQKIFLTILWIFLIGSLVFFKSFLSLDCIILPAPLWFTFLLLNVGFIFFIFLPRPKGVFPGQHVRDRWYPRTLADIVESGQEEVGEESIRPPVKAVSPVPLIPLVLLLALVILAAPVRQSEEEWRKDESERLQRVYREAEGEVAEMEALVRDLGTRTVKIIGGGNLGSMSSEDRAGLIHRIDSLAGSVRVGLTPFHEVGIQVYSTRRKRVAWGGSPRHIRTAPGNFTRARVFTSRTQLYTLLVRYEPLPGGGLIVIDIPLEVNYRINNNYLRNVSLGEILSERYGEEIEFNFSMGEHRGEVHWDDESLKKTGSRVLYNPDLGIQAYGIVLSEAGLPLARLRVLGDPFSAVVSEREARRIFWAGIDVVLIVVILALWIYSTYGKKRSRVRGRFWNFFKRSAVFIIFLAIIRYLLLGLDIPNCILSTNLFDPALFADDVPGGLMRTTGDFLLTTLFALILVFGSIKTFRTYYTGHLEKRLTLESPFRWPVFVAKALVLFGVLAGCMWLAGNIVSRVVLNSNPRLIGLDVAFFELPVLMLHLALLFAVSAIFIACLFVCRLVLVSSGGSLRAGLLASAAALALYILLFHVHWGLFWAAAGLLVLSASIFPLIKKEEGISIIFSSFLLVLICSLVIYSVAFERYTELRMSRVLEKAQDFNHPEDNWLHVVLLDMCQEISSDVSIASRALLREESAAFEFWAESMLSLFNLSCVFDVYDSRGKCFSSFAVGMPFDPSHDPGGTAERCVEPFVESIEQETRRGAVFYYRSVSPLFHAYGNITGRVEITIPYFFEDPELLARTGPMAPEILHNVERGSLAPRIDEPENLLVARLSQNRVVDSSDPNLVAGTRLPGGVSEWFDLDLGSERYNCIVKLREKGEGFLVGYRTAGKSEGLLLWATVVSLDAMLTVISLLILVLARRIPLLRNMTPDIALAGGLGFRQKILLSFLVVSILPVIILGAFSSQFIQRRFRQESEKEAFAGVQSAVSLIDHSIRSEAESFAGSQYLSDILEGEKEAAIRDVAMLEVMQFTLFDPEGKLLLDESLSDFGQEEMDVLLEKKRIGSLTITFEHPCLYAGVVVPVELPEGPGGYLYYRRRLDDEFIKGIADVLGKDINVYYGGLIRASSERGLFIGGFLDPLVNPAVFADIALQKSKSVVLEESLGDYSYQVASSPLNVLRGLESGVLSVPMLYQPALVRKEILKTSTLILGLLALLFAATITLGVFLAGKIFTPIASLRGGTRRIIEGDLEFRLEAGAPDEIGELVDSFNTMTAALSEARRDLLQRQRYLEAVLDNVATGVMVADSEGRIITLNPSGERIIQLSREDVVGREPGEVEGEGFEPLLDLFRRDTGKVIEKEIALFSGERRRTIKAVVTSFAEGGEMLGTVVVFDDLTDLIRSKKLAAWVEMARQIAHEVKNPLTPIRLSTQLMRRAYKEGSEDFGKIFESGVETVIQQTEILRRIVSEFSSFGKVTYLKPESISLDRFLKEFISSYQGAEGVEMVYSESGDMKVQADREALRKILVNLMENALEAMPRGGKIAIGCGRSGEFVEISLVDNGPGLPPEVQERLFEPYFSTKTNGTGLGLAISQGLAREMGGEIRLGNRVGGRGVKAVVVLPISG